MNCYAGYTRPVFNGYWAMIRFARDARPSPILGEGGNPLVFPTELEAQIAVTQNLLKYFNGEYRRDGETLPTKRSEAEKQFGAIFYKGRTIPIERKAVKA